MILLHVIILQTTVSEKEKGRIRERERRRRKCLPQRHPGKEGRQEGNRGYWRREMCIGKGMGAGTLHD